VDEPPHGDALGRGAGAGGSSSLHRLNELVGLAKKSLREESLATWFREPNRALGGFVPLNLAADSRGIELLQNLLTQAAQRFTSLK